MSATLHTTLIENDFQTATIDVGEAAGRTYLKALETQACRFLNEV
jgi:hypothetical protein